MRTFPSLRTISATGALLLVTPAMAQVVPGGPPAVGVVKAESRPMTESTEINGRIQARERVDLIARVTAFMNERLFTEGAEVKKGQLLYRLERAPFEADVEVKEAAVAQARAQLENADLTLKRAQELLDKNSGTQVAVDSALASQRVAAAQVKAAEAQLHQSRINLGYTEIKSPIDGIIGRTSVTVGNVVGPTSGALATVVSADPMYVTFPVSVRRVIELRERYADKGGFDAVKIRLRLPTGELYGQIGKLDFVDIGVAQDTDTMTLRGTIPNPVIQKVGDSNLYELSDAEFVTVSLEAVEPLKVLAVPRAALLSDQQGDYLYVVNDKNVAEQRRVKLGQSTPDIAAVTEGLKPGEQVVVEGIQRVRPNLVVAPGPASQTTPRAR
ncbi:efflux RND transporter periplasmic adaptor subunit [Bradyrhizobium sp.]|uniref:efflux RND transporter periplasmic adaptor subunit n=1 Tax=Bradyrhizobium sp. TaxID=376 RepID=UPI002BFEF7D0|nr:efflux RND transporter periplasmic adaptor subunit [Bradyrhizobium sp.]HMM89930.1 efflux RND transporter periplasmic adaptor subunit [Bradyrhizobium sp.]